MIPPIKMHNNNVPIKGIMNFEITLQQLNFMFMQIGKIIIDSKSSKPVSQFRVLTSKSSSKKYVPSLPISINNNVIVHIKFAYCRLYKEKMMRETRKMQSLLLLIAQEISWQVLSWKDMHLSLKVRKEEQIAARALNIETNNAAYQYLPKLTGKYKYPIPIILQMSIIIESLKSKTCLLQSYNVLSQKSSFDTET